MEKYAADLLEAIKKDDVAAFDAVIAQRKGALSLCYGRFPALSLCYLYDAKRIAAKYRTDLIGRAYECVEGDYSCYRKFRSMAKRCLRLYVGGQRVVTPAEMLAVKGEFKQMSEVYAVSPKSEQAVNNITLIARLNFDTAVTEANGRLLVSGSPLTRTQRILIVVLLAVTALTIALSGTAIGLFGKLFGAGTEESPTVLSNENQLLEKADSGEFISLKGDVTVTETAAVFSASLNGNGHTVRLSAPFAERLTGSIKNVNFVIDGVKATAGDSFGFIAARNEGTVKDVTITAVSSEITVDTEKNPLYVGTAFGENAGTVTGLKATVVLTASNPGGGDVYMGGIVGANQGTVASCELTENSVVSTDTVDAAGIVGLNEGTVTGCTSNGAISQTTAYSLWSPNVAGIAVRNSGKISDCTNTGKLVSESTETEKMLDAYLGGIVSDNTGEIYHCKNVGALTVNVKNFEVYVGGIVALSNTNTARVNACIAECDITVNSAGEKPLTYCGGIAGGNGYLIAACCANVNYKTVGNQPYIGGITGLFDIVTYMTTENRLYDNFYVKNDKIAVDAEGNPIGNALIISLDEDNPTEKRIYLGATLGETAVDTAEGLKNGGKYW